MPYSPVKLRECPLTFLRSFRTFLRYKPGETRQMHDVIQEIRVKSNTDSKVCIAQTVQDKVWWNEFFDYVIKKFSETPLWQFSEGHLDNFLPIAVEKTDATRLYSAVVFGFGKATWSEWSMARLEWLCIEILMELHLILKQTQEGQKAVKEFLKTSDWNIAWTTHKIRVTDHDAK